MNQTQTHRIEQVTLKIAIFFASLILFLTQTILISFEAAAKESPANRNCRVLEGQNLYLSSYEDVRVLDLHLCRIDEARVGALALFLHLHPERVSPFATEIYLEHPKCESNNCQNAELYCEQVGGQVVKSYRSSFGEPQNQSFKLCQFSDNSYIETETLWRGPGDPGNFKLNQILLGEIPAAQTEPL